MMEIMKLPEDILFEIIRRLSKTSQKRLGAVSKIWGDLIIKEAASASVRSLDSGFVVFKDYCPVREVIFYRLDSKGGLTQQDTPHFSKKHIYIDMLMGSCNGVLFYSAYDNEKGHYSYHLYNPLSNQISTIHPPFPQYCDSTLLGLALDLASNHYKLVAVYNLDQISTSVSIFDSETGQWKLTFPAKFRPHLRCRDVKFFRGASSVYANGIIYWIDVGPAGLVAFSIESEIFRIFRFPRTRDTTPVREVIRESEGAIWMTDRGFKWESRGAIWESEGCLKYGIISEREGLCIWVLDHDPPDQLGTVTNDHNTAGLQCVYGWKLIFNISSQTLFGKPGILLNGYCGVSAFNEHLQIVHLETSKGIFSYDIPEKTLSGPIFSLNVKYELPFTYRWLVLPDVPLGPVKVQGESWT